jgi:hypothetical protein
VFGQNHLFVKMLLSGIPLFRVMSEDSALLTSQKNSVPYQPSGPRQTKHHPSERRGFPPGPFTVSRSFFSSLDPSGRLSSPSKRLSVIDQLQILSKFNLREDYFNRLDDVDSRPDALIHKVGIAIQISPSERQSALVRTCAKQLRKLPIRLQPSRRSSPMVRTRESLIWKLLAVDVQPSGRLCLTVRTLLSNRKRFSVKISENSIALLSVRTAQVHRSDGVRTYYSNRPFCTSAYK